MYCSAWRGGALLVVPATGEAEAGEWHEPRRRSLQWAEIAPLHSSLGDRARLRLKKKKKRKMFMMNSEVQHIYRFVTVPVAMAHDSAGY